MATSTAELVSIVIRNEAGDLLKWCRPKTQARQVINALVNLAITDPSALTNYGDLAMEDALGKFKDSGTDSCFDLVAPAPRGLVVVDMVELVILDYHDGPRPCRIGLAEALIHLKERKLGRARSKEEDLYGYLEDALGGDAISHVELGKKIYPRPFDEKLTTFINECKSQFGPGWFGAQVVINPSPWTVEWYGPWPNKGNAKAMLERIKDMGIEVTPEDNKRWNKHFRNLRYEFLH